MHDQHVTLSAIEPRQHENLATDLQITKSLAEPPVESKLGIWRSFVPGLLAPAG
jgi:hypothetical protein